MHVVDAEQVVVQHADAGVADLDGDRPEEAAVFATGAPQQLAVGGDVHQHVAEGHVEGAVVVLGVGDGIGDVETELVRQEPAQLEHGAEAVGIEAEAVDVPDELGIFDGTGDERVKLRHVGNLRQALAVEPPQGLVGQIVADGEHFLKLVVYTLHGDGIAGVGFRQHPLAGLQEGREVRQQGQGVEGADLRTGRFGIGIDFGFGGYGLDVIRIVQVLALDITVNAAVRAVNEAVGHFDAVVHLGAQRHLRQTGGGGGSLFTQGDPVLTVDDRHGNAVHVRAFYRGHFGVGLTGGIIRFLEVGVRDPAGIDLFPALVFAVGILAAVAHAAGDNGAYRDLDNTGGAAVRHIPHGSIFGHVDDHLVAGKALVHREVGFLQIFVLDVADFAAELALDKAVVGHAAVGHQLAQMHLRQALGSAVARFAQGNPLLAVVHAHDVRQSGSHDRNDRQQHAQAHQDTHQSFHVENLLHI